MKRREMIRNTAFYLGGVCLCNNVSGQNDDIPPCCYTPDIEPESLIENKDSFIIDQTKAASIRKTGTAAYVDSNEKDIKIILVHAKRRLYYALSRLCTHGGQALSYIRERKLLQCNSFNHSLFELNGKVWKGPAPDTVKTYTVTLSGSKLRILF